MPKTDTKKAAMNRLFGSTPVVEERKPAKVAVPVAEKDKSDETEVVPQASVPTETEITKPELPMPASSTAEPPLQPISSPAITEETDVKPTGYVGKGKYRRHDGIFERISPYVFPDQAQALRMAAASRSDPNGTDISEIVQSVLDRAGYCDPATAKFRQTS